MSPHRKTQTSTAPPAARHPNSPKQASQLTYNVRLNAHSRDVALTERHQPDVMVLTETHLRAEKKKDGSRNAQRVHDLGGLHFRGPPAGE
jgi:hypothetical protein